MSNLLAAEVREDFRRSALNKLRNEGKVPAVVYGKDKETKAIAVDRVELLKLLRKDGRNAIISLEVNGNRENVMLTDYQTDMISNEILHVDFLLVDMDQELQTKVPVSIVGEAAGVKSGGVIQLDMDELQVTAKPKEIPEVIEIDVSELEIGNSVKVSDIVNNYPNVTFNHEDDEVILSIVTAKATAAEEEEEKEEETVEA